MATTNDRGLDAALALQAAGVRIAAVADLRPDAGGGELAGARRGRRDRAPARHDRRPRRRPPGRDRRGARARRRLGLRARGPRAHVRLRPDRRLGRRRRRRPRCSSRAARRRATTRRPAASSPTGCTTSCMPPAPSPATTTPTAPSSRAGSPAPRPRSPWPATTARARPSSSRIAPRCATVPRPRPTPRRRPSRASAASGGKAFVDLDEDVTTKDIALAAAEGYDSIELSKRYTTVTMGPSQGRFSQLASIRALGAHTGLTLGRGRHDHGAAAVGQRADGRARGPAVRARQALGDPRPPARAEGDREVGGRLAPRLRLRRPGGRGARRARVRGRDRRLHARQAARPRAGRGRAARPPVPEPVLRPQARAHPLRRDDLRRRPDHGRRHDLPDRRRHVLRHDHVERRGRDRGVVRLVARGVGARGATSPTSPRRCAPSTSRARRRARSSAG